MEIVMEFGNWGTRGMIGGMDLYQSAVEVLDAHYVR